MSSTETTPGGHREPTEEAPSLSPSQYEDAAEGAAEVIEQVVGEMDHWQHLVFNAAHSSNRAGLTTTAHEIQQAAYRLRLMLGYEDREARILSDLPLTDEQKAEVAEESRAESVRAHQDGLRDLPVPQIRFPRGRKADRERSE